MQHYPQMCTFIAYPYAFLLSIKCALLNVYNAPLHEHDLTSVVIIKDPNHRGRFKGREKIRLK